MASSTTVALFWVLLLAQFTCSVALCMPDGTTSAYVASFGSDSEDCGRESSPCATVAVALSHITASDECPLNAELVISSALDGTLEGNYDNVVDQSYGFASFTLRGMGMAVTLDGAVFLSFVEMEGDISLLGLSFTDCSTCIDVVSHTGYDLIVDQMIGSGCLEDWQCSAVFCLVRAFRLTQGSQSQTLLSANIRGNLQMSGFSTYESGVLEQFPASGQDDVRRQFTHPVQGEDGCSGFLLSLGSESSAEISKIGSSAVYQGHQAVFCIMAEQTTTVSISELSISNGASLGDEGAGIYTEGGVISIDRGAFNNIAANFGSAINARDFAYLSVTNSAFTLLGDSQRTNGGGAIYASSYIDGAEFRLANCTSNGSSVGGYAGGFLLLEGTSSATIDNNQLTASYCNYGFGGFIMLRDLANTAITNTIFSGGFASQGAGIACVNSTGTTLDVVQFQDMSSTSLNPDTIDLFGYSCSSPIWTSQVPCSTVSCTSCESTVCGSDPPLSVCSCYCTGIGDDCDSQSAPPTTLPLPSASRTPTVPTTPSVTPTPSASGSLPVLPESSYSSEPVSSVEEEPDGIPFAVVFTVAALMVILVVVLVGFLAVFGFFAYVKYFKPESGSIQAPAYDTIAMADPVTPQRDDDKYQYDVEE